jgi:hypothetical protein
MWHFSTLAYHLFDKYFSVWYDLSRSITINSKERTNESLD